jgi:hypothetical protein
MKHTSGPWKYIKANPSPTTGEHLIAGARPGYLAEVRDCGSGDVAANAHLIAAAPDLLAALQEFIDCGANAGNNAALIAQCRAAIAKATGETA